MSVRAYKINSNLAEYSDEEFSAIETLLAIEGVFDTSGTDQDFEVTESSPAAMTVDVAVGSALVEYLKSAVTWKVVVNSNAVETVTISANSSGNNRVDAIVIHLAQTEPNALKNNVATVEVVLGDGAVTLSDADINTTLGDTNWYRLADIVVPDGTLDIENGDITDTRARVTLDALPTDGATNYVTLTGNQTVAGIKTFSSFPITPSAAPTTNYQVSNKKYVDDIVDASTANIVTLTAGEAIDGSSTPQAVCMSDNGKDSYAIVALNGDYGYSGGAFAASGFGGTDAAYKLSQSFIYTNADVTSITVSRASVNIRKEGAPTDNVRVVIYDDNGNKPGSALTNGESTWVSGVGFTSAADDILPQAFVFPTPPTIVSGTMYHYVLERSGVIDAVNYYALHKNSNAQNFPNYRSSYTASSQLWAAGITGNTSWWYMYIEFELEGGKVFKADSDNLSRMKFLGFVIDNVAKDAPANVTINGAVTMAVDEGEIYYIDTTKGAITIEIPTASEECIIPIGYGGDGELIIDKSSIRQYYRTTAYFSNNGTANTDKIVVLYWAAGGSHSWWVKTGITPFKNDSTVTNGTISRVDQGGFYVTATQAGGDMHTLAIDAIGY